MSTSTSAIAHVHVTTTDMNTHELTPPHPPRQETPIYAATHKRLVIDEDRPCFVCGVRRSDLAQVGTRLDPHINPFGATEIETHHFPIERSLADAIDPERVAQAYPTVRQFKSFIEWVDSEYNMLVLCSACHRTGDHAIHHAPWQDFIAEKFAKRDESGRPYQFLARASDSADEQRALALDEHIEQRDGTEALVAHETTQATQTTSTSSSSKARKRVRHP